jgi:hypothetical protein
MTFFTYKWVFNEADTVVSSSILIYECSEQSLNTQGNWQDAVVIKSTIRKLGGKLLIRCK